MNQTTLENRSRFSNLWDIVAKLARYNLKIVFANKFIYFLLASVFFFLVVMATRLFSGNIPSPGALYYLLLFPGVLIIFYPTTFGIQHDEDSRMLEIIFGIPNYRYKVWLVRMILIYLVVPAILVLLAFVSKILLIDIPVFAMVFQIMFPVFFLGGLAFMVSTLARNGNATAVIMVVAGTAFWIASAPLEQSAWNIFLNPYEIPGDVNDAVWADISLNNRIYLMVAAILAVLSGLLNLQKREKFI